MHKDNVKGQKSSWDIGNCNKLIYHGVTNSRGVPSIVNADLSKVMRRKNYSGQNYKIMHP